MKSRSLTILVACITACAFLSACGDAKASSDKNNKEIQHMLDKPQKSSDDTKKESPKKKSESKKKKKKKDKETVKEERKDDRKEAFQEILYKYKEAQDMKYSMDEVESMGLHLGISMTRLLVTILRCSNADLGTEMNLIIRSVPIT